MVSEISTWCVYIGSKVQSTEYMYIEVMLMETDARGVDIGWR